MTKRHQPEKEPKATSAAQARADRKRSQPSQRQAIDLLALNLDWRLASQRLRKDLRDDFWPDPLGYNDILGSPDTILERLTAQLQEYRPTKGQSCPIPKANFTIRDSIQLAPLDRLVYQALIDPLIASIDPQFTTSVYSHRLRRADDKWMFPSGVQAFRRFTDAIKAPRQPHHFLIVTDIAQYFEHVRFRTLRQQLDHLLKNAQRDDLTQIAHTLIECLTAWSPYDGYGIPQNVDASSFLGNVLLDYVDRCMSKDGYPIFRYMDDIRLLVNTEADARKALIILIGHLRELGLGLNAAKTHILSPTDERAAQYLPAGDPVVERIEEAINTKRHEPIQGIVATLFEKTRSLVREKRTGDGIFRFCINRIASLYAYKNLAMPDTQDITDSIIALLITKPADTGTFCSYLEVAPLEQRHLDEIERLIVHEPLMVYWWQNFLLWRLISQRRMSSIALTIAAHHAVKERQHTPEAAGAALYLGQHGDYADRLRIAQQLPAAPRGLVTRAYQIAIQELSTAERTKAYHAIREDDHHHATLTDHLKGLAEPIYVDQPARIGIDDLPYQLPSIYT